MANPKILNLDDLELPETDITIRHKDQDHKMRVLEVDMFIAQQKRAAQHQKMVAEGKLDEQADDVSDVVSLIKDAILEFFPTLPVGELPTPKLFAIFAWMNEVTAQLNEAGAPEDGEGVSAEGNVPVAVEADQS